MIPKLAIEKAIKGGWSDKRQAPHLAGGLGVALIQNYLPAVIALDPTFWQVLGVKCQENWIELGDSFCHLILTGQSTEPFWQKILK